MKKIVILGAAESGIGAAVLAKKKGYRVWVSDNGSINNKYKKVLLHNEIEWEDHKHSLDKILMADEIIKSPGIPDNAEVIRKALEKGINVISEIEFAARFTKAKLIGITGTNGKTTTVSLVYDIYKRAGKDVCLAGNVGKSFALALSKRDYDYFVLEISSFQLMGMFNTRFHTAAILNITPDHLDRHNNRFDDYVDAKFRMVRNQTEEDALVFGGDDERLSCEVINRNIKAQKIPFFSLVNDKRHNEEYNNKVYLTTNKMYIKYNSDCFDMFFEDFSLKGKHNTLNAMAASIIAARDNIRKEKIKESLHNFTNIEHRLEYVCKIRSVEYYNDSKATNVNSTWYALENFKNPIVWIAGGIDKGNDYTRLKPLVNEKVKALICLGLDNEKMVSAFEEDVQEIYHAKAMQDAVNKAYKISEPGDIVILSPACSSFDLFKNFEDRGNQFKNAVLNL